MRINGLLKEHKMDDLTTEQVQQHYTAMGHSVALINDIIAGDAMADDTAEDKQDCVDRNVRHLKSWLPKTSGQTKI
jgi:hypothetical protein